MKITITDPELGTRSFDSEDHVALIKDQLRLLCSFRDDGRVPSKHLLEDIKVYEYMLEHPQASQKIEDYMKEKDRRLKAGAPITVNKMEIAKKLGWFQ